MRTAWCGLMGDLDGGEGDVVFGDEFDALDPLMKIDFLGDWIGDLQKEYNKSYNEWGDFLADQGGNNGSVH